MNLLQEFNEESTNFGSNLESVSSKVVEEIWGSGPIFNVDPFDYQRSGFKKGTIFKKNPSNTNKRICYSFDASKRIIMTRKGIEIPDHYYTEFFFYTDFTLKSVLYGTDKELINVKVRQIEEGKIIKLSMKAIHGSREEEYAYEHDKLISITVKQWEGEIEKPGFTTVFNYSGDELEEIVNIYYNGYRDVKYKSK